VPIAVFDVDGTLTDTVDVDVECYEAAILETIDLRVPRDWPSFDEITDPAILARACELRGRPVPDVETERRIATRVGELLSEALERTPERFSAMPGAHGVFAALRAEGWDVAMATGAWRPSAEVKLRGAGVPTRRVALATSSDHRKRRDIIRRAVAMCAPEPDDGVVYVGDGVWDGRAARSLGLGFVGIGRGKRRASLRKEGAADVLDDLADVRRLLRSLHQALQRRTSA
jgi:phosphoglycolate phosphatase-like HAD superfamily hydrolase